MVTDASTWKKSTPTKELTLPSGNVALVKPIAMDTLIARGAIPNSLLTIVEDELSKNEGKPDPKTQAERAADVLTNSPEQLAEMFSFADRVVLECVVQPVLKIREPGEVNDDVLFMDEIDLEDKMFIFNWAVGGTTDLARFREESASVVEHLESRQGLSLPTQ